MPKDGTKAKGSVDVFETEVFKTELKEIEERRKAAGIRQETKTQISDDLVGLALSGGGIRSAGFNLGILQALNEKDMLRDVDYLSTVSGGGYIGSLMTSSVVKADGYCGKDSFPLGLQQDGRQPKEVDDLLDHGNYLLKLAKAANRYFFGTLLNNLLIFSGLLCLATALAIVWRLLDYDWVRDRLSLLGFSGDVWPALLPAVVLSVFWFIAWCISYWKKGALAEGLWARSLLGITVLSFLIGAAVLIGNGDVTTVGGADAKIQERLRVPLAILAALGLLPYLFPRQLLRSGARGKNIFESWMFRYLSIALLLGIPLVLVGVMARENISGFGTQRSGLLDRADIKDWSAFCNWLTTERTFDLDDVIEKQPQSNGNKPPNEERVNIWLTIPDEIKNNKSFAKKIDDLRENEREYAKFQRQISGSSEWEGSIAWREPQLSDRLNAEPVFLDATTARKQDLDPADFQSWESWEFLTYWDRWGYLLINLLPDRWTAEDPFGNALFIAQQNRELQTDILDFVNKNVVKNEKFFRQTSFALSTDARHAELFKTRITNNPALRTLLERRDLFDNRSDNNLQNDNAGGDLFTEEQTVEMNRLLLEACFPDWIRPRKDIRRVTVHAADQVTRLVWFGLALVVFVALSFIVYPNATSLQSYYQSQLTDEFIRPTNGGVRPRLADVKIHKKGWPYHLLIATVNPMPLGNEPNMPEAFQFAPDYCGSKTLGYCPTEKYKDDRGRPISLAMAMSVSGAAVSPLISRNWLVRAMMTVLNFRLGQWLPNPNGREKARGRATAQRLVRCAGKDVRKSPYVFVSDGGHTDNLGVAALLKRRCKWIIASDASQDPKSNFIDLSKLIQNARRAGIEFLEVTSNRPLRLDQRFPQGSWDDEDKQFHYDRKERRKPHYFCARVRYPGDGKPHYGTLIYVKPSLNGDEEPSVLRYKDKERDFPHETTADQTYDRDHFEVYVQLGLHIGSEVFQSLAKVGPADLNAIRNASFRRDLYERLKTEDAASVRRMFSDWQDREGDFAHAEDEFIRHCADCHSDADRELFRKALAILADVKNTTPAEFLADYCLEAKSLEREQLLSALGAIRVLLDLPNTRILDLMRGAIVRAEAANDERVQFASIDTLAGFASKSSGCRRVLDEIANDDQYKFLKETVRDHARDALQPFDVDVAADRENQFKSKKVQDTLPRIVKKTSKKGNPSAPRRRKKK